MGGTIVTLKSQKNINVVPDYRVEYYNPKTNKMECNIRKGGIAADVAEIKSELNKKGMICVSICILKDFEEIKNKFDKFTLDNYKPIMRPLRY